MRKTVTFTVSGKPFGKQRPKTATRVVRTADGGFKKQTRAYTPRETVDYEQQVKLAYMSQTGGYKFPEGTPLEVKLIAYYQKPKSMTKKNQELVASGKFFPLVKPDLDNVCKSILDALNGTAFKDDANVVRADLSKRYSDCEPGIWIEISEYFGDDTIHLLTK